MHIFVKNQKSFKLGVGVVLIKIHAKFHLCTCDSLATLLDRVNVPDGRTDRQTDGRTDGRIPRLVYITSWPRALHGVL